MQSPCRSSIIDVRILILTGLNMASVKMCQLPLVFILEGRMVETLPARLHG